MRSVASARANNTDKIKSKVKRSFDLAFFCFPNETVSNQYLGGDTSLACSAQTQREIDQRVVDLVKAQHEKAIKILTDNRAKLDELAKYLYEKETITGEEFMSILNKGGEEE